jgi:hypothetical protein
VAKTLASRLAPRMWIATNVPSFGSIASMITLCWSSRRRGSYIALRNRG